MSASRSLTRRAFSIGLAAGLFTSRSYGQERSLSRERAVSEALARSPRTAILVADTAAALAGLLTARTLPNPTIAGVYSRDTPNYHLTADYPIDFFWLRGPRVQAAQLDRDAARYRYVYERAVVALDADTTYTRALAQSEKSRLSARTARDADSLLRMAIARRNAGDASELDVQLATVSAAQQANVAAADSLAAVSALLDLQALLGLSSDHVEIALTDSLTDPAAAPVRPQGSPLSIAAAQATLSSALLAARLQRRSVWTGVGLMLGIETGDPGGNGNALLPTFGVSFPIPFFDRNRGAVAQADAQRQRAEAELALARIETNAAFARATRERENAIARLARDRITVDAANRVAAMSLTAYREGAMALPSVLEAQRTARDVLGQYIDDLAAAWIATAALRVVTLTSAGPP
jgi:cobalt-zinc-cadmium efflux system outer membrane protein